MGKDDYRSALDAAVDAAKQARKLLRQEFHRAGGPRGSSGHAEVDEQAEQLIRERILAAFPAAYLGEETGSASGGDAESIWLVDPNDGTSAYLKGWRGSAVSTALLRQGALTHPHQVCQDACELGIERFRRELDQLPAKVRDDIIQSLRDRAEKHGIEFVMPSELRSLLADG